MKLLELTKRIIAFESTSTNELGLVEFISKLLNENKIKHEIDRFRHNEKETANIYVEAGNKNANNNETLIFYAHTDVVKGESAQFIPEIKKDKLFGRGAADMKSALAAQVYVLLNYKDHLSKLTQKIIFVFIADEEASSSG